jgi:16S rRNA (cytidine1402-2'-O)-methyltransferase
VTGSDRPEAPRAGRLLVVATPLGNLSDITLRAVEALRAADLVVCEDTRRTRGLLSHLGIATPLRSHHKFNEAAGVSALVELLAGGRCLTLVSDAGTPGLSDPGARLVRAARAAGHSVEPIPGPSAPAAAISAAGFEAAGYLFAGYPPARAAARRQFFEGLRAMESARAAADRKAGPCPIVFFEAPHRIVASLVGMIEVLGDRPAVLFREMTKLHEEGIAGSLAEILERLKGSQVRGEITLVVEGGGADARPQEPIGQAALGDRYRRLIEAGAPRKEALRKLSSLTGLSRRQLYRELFLEDSAGAPSPAGEGGGDGEGEG